MLEIKDQRKCIVNLGDVNSVIQEGTTYTDPVSVVRRGVDSVITPAMEYYTYQIHINDSNGDVYASGSFDEEGKATVRFLFDKNYISCE